MNEFSSVDEFLDVYIRMAESLFNGNNGKDASGSFRLEARVNGQQVSVFAGIIVKYRRETILAIHFDGSNLPTEECIIRKDSEEEVRQFVFSEEGKAELRKGLSDWVLGEGFHRWTANTGIREAQEETGVQKREARKRRRKKRGLLAAGYRLYHRWQRMLGRLIWI